MEGLRTSAQPSACFSMCVFAHINGTHFAHETGPTTCKMIIKNGPPHLYFLIHLTLSSFEAISQVEQAIVLCFCNCLLRDLQLQDI